MTSTGPASDRSRGAFSTDSTAPDTAPQGFVAFRQGWQTQLGNQFPLPTFNPATTGDFRVKGRGSRLHDVVILDLHGASAVRALGTPKRAEDQVRMYMVHRGAWTMSSPSQRNEDTVPAGQFLIRHFEAPPRFETLPGTTARMLYLPSAVARPLLKDRIVTGSADSAEMRLLLAHINMVHSTATNLGAAGVHAARSTLIELSKAVVKQQFDDVEPLLAPSLAQAAKDLADRHLANPELSVAMLAGELKVSVRTLHRAFAMTEESVATYIRNRRLEEARLALTAPSSPLSISEIAAYWHFNDSSHFIRSFKRRYGQTPASYARSTRPHNR